MQSIVCYRSFVELPFEISDIISYLLVLTPNQYVLPPFKKINFTSGGVTWDPNAYNFDEVG